MQERVYMMLRMNGAGECNDYGSSEDGSYEHEHEEELEHHHRVHLQEHLGGVHGDGDDDLKAEGEGYLEEWRRGRALRGFEEEGFD